MDGEQIKEIEQGETETEEEKVDLNRVFREVEHDLNSMFPDGEMRKFLKQLNKNRRGNERFLEGIEQARLLEEDE